MTDAHYFEAVRLWGEGEKSRRLFAYECAMVEGKHTSALAADCRLSVATIGDYRNAYILAYALDLELSETSQMWNGLNISLWVAAARKRSSIPDEALRGYLNDAMVTGCTVESFRVILDNHNRTKPEWVTRLTRMVKSLGKLITDWKPEMSPELRARFDKATAWYAKELQEIAEAE